jgi:hypothetical protein
MKNVPPMPGEEGSTTGLPTAAGNDSTIKKTLKETAVAAERELIDPFLLWDYNGRAAWQWLELASEQCEVGNRLPQPRREPRVEHVRQSAGRKRQIFCVKSLREG